MSHVATALVQSRPFCAARLRRLYRACGGLLNRDRFGDGLLPLIRTRTTAHSMAQLVAPAADTEQGLLELAARHRIAAEEPLVGVATEVA